MHGWCNASKALHYIVNGPLVVTILLFPTTIPFYGPPFCLTLTFAFYWSVLTQCQRHTSLCTYVRAVMTSYILIQSLTSTTADRHVTNNCMENAKQLVVFSPFCVCVCFARMVVGWSVFTSLISFSRMAYQIPIPREENALMSLSHPHYTHSPNNAESASNLVLPSWLSHTSKPPTLTNSPSLHM